MTRLGCIDLTELKIIQLQSSLTSSRDTPCYYNPNHSFGGVKFVVQPIRLLCVLADRQTSCKGQRGYYAPIGWPSLRSCDLRQARLSMIFECHHLSVLLFSQSLPIATLRCLTSHSESPSLPVPSSFQTECSDHAFRPSFRVC